MRLLFLIPTLQNAGAERQLAYLASELVGRGHDIHVGYCQDGPNFARLASCGAVLHRFLDEQASRRRGWDFRNYNPLLIGKIIRLIQAVRPNVVQTCLPQMDVLGGLGCLLTGTAWVLREPSCSDAYGRSFRTVLRRWTARAATAVVANSAGGERYWQERNPTLPRFRVANGIPLQDIDRTPRGSPADLGCRPEEKLVLYVGRLNEVKNATNLTLAALQLLQLVPNLRVWLCGDGPERPRIARLVAHGNWEGRICLPGSVDNPWALMKCATVFVSISKFEGFPNAVMEAMACGCPVVVSDIPAHREFLDERTAVFVNPNQPVEIAQAIAELLSDRAAARARAEQGRTTIERFSVAAMARGYEEVYQSLLAREGVRDFKNRGA